MERNGSCLRAESECEMGTSQRPVTARGEHGKHRRTEHLHTVRCASPHASHHTVPLLTTLQTRSCAVPTPARQALCLRPRKGGALSERALSGTRPLGTRPLGNAPSRDANPGGSTEPGDSADRTFSAPSDSVLCALSPNKSAWLPTGGFSSGSCVETKAKLTQCPKQVLITATRLNIFPGWERERNLKEEIIESSKADCK